MFHAQTFLSPVGAVLSPCESRRQYSERKVVVCQFHIPHTAHLKHSVVFTGTGHMRLSQGMSPSTNAISLHREDLLMRSVQVTPILQEGNVSRRTTSNSLPALPSVPSDHFYDTVEITNSTTMQVDLLAGTTPCRRRIVRTRRRRKKYLDHWILRNFASDSDFLKNWYEANLKQWKEDARVALFYQDQQFKIAVVNTKDRQGCPQSGCERILRKLRSCDDSRNSRYSNSYE